MHAGDFGVLAMAGQQSPHHVFAEAEAAHQHVGGGDLDDLRHAQVGDDAGDLLPDAETEHGLCAVFANHALREQQVRQIRFANLVEHLILFHAGPLVLTPDLPVGVSPIHDTGP